MNVLICRFHLNIFLWINVFYMLSTIKSFVSTLCLETFFNGREKLLSNKLAVMSTNGGFWRLIRDFTIGSESSVDI